MIPVARRVVATDRGLAASAARSVAASVALGLVSLGCALDARPAADQGSEPATGGDAAASGDATPTQSSRRMVLTFDDLPANSYLSTTGAYESVTGPLVAGLVRLDIPAVGFVNEVKLYEDDVLVPRRVATLEAWVEAGLELGNHSFSHPDINTTPLEVYQADVLAGERVTRELMTAAGREPRFFRHPFLHTGTSLEIKDAFKSFLREHGYRVAPVTIDNQEWIFARAYDHAQVRGDSQLAGRIGDGYLVYMDSITGYYEAQSRAILGYEIPQIMLLHANQLNADVLDRLVASLRARGYEFVTLEDALEDPGYGSPDEYAGTSGITWLHRWALTQGKRGEFFAGEPDVPAFVQETYENPPRRQPDSRPPTAGRSG